MAMTSDMLIPGMVALVMGYLLFKRRGGIDSAEARRLVEAGGLLVDVRTAQEFASGHLPGALNMPVQELEARMGELHERNRPIVLYCRSGARSSSAARMLERAGFTAVHDLGPMGRW